METGRRTRRRRAGCTSVKALCFHLILKLQETQWLFHFTVQRWWHNPLITPSSIKSAPLSPPLCLFSLSPSRFLFPVCNRAHCWPLWLSWGQSEMKKPWFPIFYSSLLFHYLHSNWPNLKSLLCAQRSWIWDFSTRSLHKGFIFLLLLCESSSWKKSPSEPCGQRGSPAWEG